MSWFRVDDNFADHPKVLTLRGSKRGRLALALWTLAGSWCARHLTDGSISLEAITNLGGTRAEAELLVTATLWIRTPDGYAFHDWNDRNPSRKQIEAKREKTATKVKAWRAGESARTAAGNQGSNQVTEGACNLVTDPGSTSERNPAPVPSRPDPIPRERAHAPPLALVRASDEENRPAGQELSRSQFISVLISGVRQAFESEGRAPPKQTRILTWRGWDDIAAWCETQSALERRSPIDVAKRLVRGFMIVESRKHRGYPLPFLAENPGEYWEAAA